MLSAVYAQSIEADIAASSPTNKVWIQTEWIGDGGMVTVEEKDKDGFTGYYVAGSQSTVPGRNGG